MRFLAAILGFTFAYGDQISLLSLIQNKVAPSQPQKLAPVDNCLKAESNLCLQCAQGYEIDSGLCLKIDDTKQFLNQLQSGFLPCKGKENCGEAQGFVNSKEFTDFVSKYTSPSPSVNLVKNPQLFADTAVAQPLAFRSAGMGMSTQNTIQASQFVKIAPSFAPAPAPAPAPKPVEGRDFSGTNNQVDAVDEADLLKTDGTYIYTISNKVLSIILAYPVSQASVISKINLKDVNAEALFIEGNYLSVFGTDYSTESPFTFIKIYDINNRARPFLSRTFKVAGRYTNGRKTSDGFVYLITNQSLNTKPRPWFDFGFGTSQLAFNSIFRYPVAYIQPQLTNIISFNLRRPIGNDKSVVSICGETSTVMFMSERSIYLTSTSYANGQEYTNIRKVFIWKKNIIPFADAKIRGSINNQFSLDQYGPYLRVAATLNNLGKTSNTVYTLGFYLQPFGQLAEIAAGERIFSARFVERKLYLVTFRQVDPFFVISFSNHRKPKMLGQLKVPGFSRYLHPYDEETIIGLGRQADSTGRQQGLKISLFDVSDVNSPKELAKMQVEQKYASSTAEWEHKAFLFSAQKKLIVIPTTMNNGENKFNGALAIHISKEEKLITPRAAIDHLVSPNDNFYGSGVERSLYIEDYLYTKSKCLLRINQINDHFDAAKDVKIPCDQTPDPVYRIPRLPPIMPRPLPEPIVIDDPIAVPLFRQDATIQNPRL